MSGSQRQHAMTLQSQLEKERSENRQQYQQDLAPVKEQLQVGCPRCATYLITPLDNNFDIDNMSHIFKTTSLDNRKFKAFHQCTGGGIYQLHIRAI